MTYSELKTNIANYLNRSDLTDQMDMFIDNVEGEVNRRVRRKEMIKRATATADAQYLSLPNDWLEAINVEITSNNFSPILQQDNLCILHLWTIQWNLHLPLMLVIHYN
jgi:hypothetical protein